ncbi:MAG: histidine phosphatase family protein [Burkholderiaceae bacterium]
MSKTMELWLCRHGETDWNAARRIQGQLDVPLNALGQAQAKRLAQALAHHDFDEVVSSPLGRAHQTALPLAQVLSLPVVLEAALAERHFGDLQGQSFDDMASIDPQAAAHWQARTPAFCPTGGESLIMLRDRVEAGLHGLACRALDAGASRIICFTHGGVLDMVYRIAQGIDISSPRDWGIPNAGINQLRVVQSASQGLSFQLVAWAQTDHLIDLALHDSLGI